MYIPFNNLLRLWLIPLSQLCLLSPFLIYLRLHWHDDNSVNNKCWLTDWKVCLWFSLVMFFSSLNLTWFKYYSIKKMVILVSNKKKSFPPLNSEKETLLLWGEGCMCVVSNSTVGWLISCWCSALIPPTCGNELAHIHTPPQPIDHFPSEKMWKSGEKKILLFS